MTLVHVVFKNTWRNPRRSVLTIISLAVLFLLLTFLMMIWGGYHSDPWAKQWALRLVCRNRFSLSASLPSRYRNKIRAIPGVMHIVPISHFSGQYQDGSHLTEFPQIGTDPNEIMSVYPDYQLPSEQLAEWQANPRGAIVESSLARKTKWKLGDHIVLRGMAVPFDLDLTICGIFMAPYPLPVLYFNSNYLRRITHRETDDAYMILADSPQSIAPIALAVDEMFHNSGAPTRTEAEQSLSLERASLLGDMQVLIVCIGSAVLFVGLLVVANSMGLSLREREREFSIMRSIGFTPRHLQSLVLGEVLTLCLVAWLLASLATYGLLHALNRWEAGAALGMLAKIRVPVLLTTLFIALDVGMAGSLYSAYRVARANIAQGLRSTR